MIKQKLLLIAFLLVVAGQVWGQDSLKSNQVTFTRNFIVKPNILLQSDDGVYKIDFKNENEAQNGFIEIRPFGQNAYPKSYKKGSTVKFKIHNVNFLRVQGSKVESKGTNFSFDASNEFKRLINEINEINEKNEKNTSNGANGSLLVDTTKGSFISDYKNFLRQLSSIESALSLAKDLKSAVGQDVFIKDTIWVNGQVDKLYNNAYEHERGEDFNAKVYELQGLYTILKDSYIAANDSLGQSEATVSGELKNKDGWVVKVSDAKISQTIKNKYADEFDFATKAIAVFTVASKNKEMYQTAQEGTDLYFLIKRNDFIHYTDAIQLNDDFVTLTPKLLDRENKTIHEFEPLTVRTKGGVKVNLSTGYLLSFISGEEFDYRRNSKGEIVGVKSIGENKLTHGVGVLAHAFWDCYTDVQFGISTGLSLNTDSKINYYLGASVGVMEANRLIFSVGWSLVNIQQLNRSNLNNNNNFISAQHTEINYVNRYKDGFFFGITYNLINKK